MDTLNASDLQRRKTNDAFGPSEAGDSNPPVGLPRSEHSNPETSPAQSPDDPYDKSANRGSRAPLVYSIVEQSAGIAGWILVLVFSLKHPSYYQPWEMSWELGVFMSMAFVARLLGFRVVQKVRIALDTAIYVAGAFILGIVPAAWLILLVLTVDTGVGLIRGKYTIREQETETRNIFRKLITRGGLPALFMLGLGAAFDIGPLPTTVEPKILVQVPTFTVAVLLTHYLLVLSAEAMSGFSSGAMIRALIYRLLRAEFTQIPIALTMVLGYIYGGLPFFLLLGFTALMFSGIFQRNALARRQISDRLDELSTLNEVGKIISASLEIGPLLQHLASATLKHVGATSRFTVGLINEDGQGITHEIFDASGKRYNTLNVSQDTGLSGWVLRHRTPLMLGDVQREYSQFAQTEDRQIERFRSWLCVPIMLYEEVIGVMSVQSDYRDAYTHDHLRVFTTIVDQAAVAIENARLYEANAQAMDQLSERVEELSTLNEVGKAISGILERDPLLEKIAQATLKLVGESSRFMICMAHEGEDLLVGGLFDHTGKRYEEISAGRDHSLSGWVMNNRKPLLMGDVQNQYHLYLDKYEYNDTSFHSWLCVPMIYNNAVIGAMSVQSEQMHVYTEDHQRVFTNVADQAAVALENTRLYELATIDGLTGLYVRRHFDQRLYDEWERAKRYGNEIALILFDLDRFKSINDTHGHQVGDEILKRAADSVRAHLRFSDLPCRFGGDEFAIILPRTDIDGASLVAERIRKEIEKQEVLVEGKKIPVTCSLGISSFPEVDVHKFHDLLGRADAALYAAKDRGRNRVMNSLQLPPLKESGNE